MKPLAMITIFKQQDCNALAVESKGITPKGEVSNPLSKMDGSAGNKCASLQKFEV